jgi:hypothetical protein
LPAAHRFSSKRVAVSQRGDNFFLPAWTVVSKASMKATTGVLYQHKTRGVINLWSHHMLSSYYYAGNATIDGFTITVTPAVVDEHAGLPRLATRLISKWVRFNR